MEQRVACLRLLASMDMDADITHLMTDERKRTREDMISAILSDPCIARYDFRKRPYLLTDFSKLGFGYNLCQPNDDAASLAAMNREMAGGDCEFLRPKSKLLLRTTGFGSRKTRGREQNLHSHLGEGFALDWALNRNRAQLWGVRFTAITDCYGLRFILSYDGPNPVILRLQMRLMLWAMDLHHRSARFLFSPDYLSRLGADLCFDEMSRLYLSKTSEIRRMHAPVSGAMRPENMPGYRQPTIRTDLPVDKPVSPVTTAASCWVDPAIAPLLTSITVGRSNGHEFCLQTVPVLTGHLSLAEQDSLRHVHFHNHEISVHAAEVISCSFVVYGFNSGHFTTHRGAAPFHVVMAADTRPCGRALFKQISCCPIISESADGLLNCIASSGARSSVHGYCIHSHRFLNRETEKKFWTVQAAIVRALRQKRGLVTLWAFVHPSCDLVLAAGFRRAIQRTGWVVSVTDIYYPDMGDAVADSGMFFLGIHKGASENKSPINVTFPPASQPKSLASFVYAPFNKREHAVSLSPHHPDFASSGCVSSPPVATATPTRQHRAKCTCTLHRNGDDKMVSAGAGVYDISGLCPPFCSSNSNAFASTFGIEFEDDDATFIRPVSAYEVACCFQLSNDLTHVISHPENFCLLDCGVPSITSRVLFDAILKRLEAVRAENFETLDSVSSRTRSQGVLDPSRFAAPAALAQIAAYTNGAVGSRIPGNDAWRRALLDDPVTSLLLDIVANPAKGESQSVIQPLDHIYRQPARQGHFSTRDGILYMKEVFQNDTKFVELRIVPTSLVNIIFIAFHANPIGGHLNVYRTYHRIRQRYFWPGMYQYIKRMCKACPGCGLSNITKNRCADLVYSFPMDAPMKVLFVDIYAAGTEFNFEGTRHYLIAACGMTSFAVCEDTAEQNSTIFSAALMKIWLRFGFSHTIVVDKDSKFLGEFVKTAALLKINIHSLSGGNHDPMIVERVC